MYLHWIRAEACSNSAATPHWVIWKCSCLLCLLILNLEFKSHCVVTHSACCHSSCCRTLSRWHVEDALSFDNSGWEVDQVKLGFWLLCKCPGAQKFRMCWEGSRNLSQGPLGVVSALEGAGNYQWGKWTCCCKTQSDSDKYRMLSGRLIETRCPQWLSLLFC